MGTLCAGVSAFLTLAGLALADTQVGLPDEEKFAANDPDFVTVTTVPGNFTTPEGVVGALLTLGDQAADPKVHSPFMRKDIPGENGKKVAAPLFTFFRGARLEGDRMVVCFSGGAMVYLNSTVAMQSILKGSLEKTIRLNFPQVKSVEYEVDGELVKDWDA